MDPITILVILSILIGIVIIIFLSITQNSSSSSTTESTVTISCNNNPTPRNLTIPSTSPFLLQTNGLGAGAFSLIYYSDSGYTNPIGNYIADTQNEPMQITPTAGTQGIQYIFLCDKIDILLSQNTPTTSINPKIPYQFSNGDIITPPFQNMTITLTDEDGNSSTIPSVPPGATAAPNPGAGYPSYSAVFS